MEEEEEEEEKKKNLEEEEEEEEEEYNPHPVAHLPTVSSMKLLSSVKGNHLEITLTTMQTISLTNELA